KPGRWEGDRTTTHPSHTCDMIMIDRVETASDRIRNNHSQNGVIQPLLTDMYQINMAYAYWKSGKHDDTAVFDLFFRKNPFHGEFTIFAGLEECLKFLESFRYSESDIQYLKETMPESVEPEFFDYLSSITTKDVKVYAIDEGKVVFPRN
ncbi:hypothetical protein OTU49_009675, partial [Cherax quadricarinatus]